ncbi:MAG TPA: PAS domain-containing protein [Azospirillum sp.]|nr:PAS domain-containing protein [Azospirillum sp.]
MPEDSPIDMAQAHWDRMRGARRMPSRADLDPVDIPRLLPVTILVEVLRDPLDFRYRLLGTEIDRIVTANYRGRCFSELEHIETGGRLWSDHERVVLTRAPVRSSVAYVGHDRFIRTLSHGLFPLSNDGETVHMIWAVAEIGRWNHRAAP